MINVSSEFKAAAVAPVKRVSASVVIDPFGDNPTTITDADNLVSFIIESTGELFSSVATVATVKLLGSDYDLIGKTIRIGYGLLVDSTNDTYEQLDYGYFTVTEAPVKKGAETTTIKAIGKMTEMQNSSYETGITYPITIANLASEIGNRFGLTVADMSTLPNVDYVIQEDLYENISEENYRNILAEIAGATASMAIVDNRTQQIIFRPHQTTVQGALDYEKLKTLTVGSHYGPVSSVVLSRLPQEDNIAVVDENMANSPGGKNKFILPANKTGRINDNSFAGTATSTSTGQATTKFDQVAFNLRPNTNYTISFNLTKSGDNLSERSGAVRLNIDNEWKNIWSGNSTTQRNSASFRTGATGAVIFGFYYFFNATTSGTVSAEWDDIQLELGTTPTQFEPFEPAGVIEVKLANNEIMDDDRTAFISNLLTAADGIEWTGFEATTVGLGWYECGDRLEFEDDQGNQVESIVTYHKITVDGGIKEELKGVTPEESTTDYALAGGVMKTIYNTEIKVDKQNQEIRSIVEEQTSFENQTNSNFTNITQNISSVVTSVQNSGGNNLIKNSAFYQVDSDNLPLYWTLSGGGTWSAIPSADASANGSLSGQVIQLANKTISQVITVKPDDDSIAEASKTYYSFSCRLKKTAVGSATITLTDGTQEGVWTISLGNNESSNYGEFAIEAILPHSTELTLTVTASNDNGIEFYVTDMMLAVGNYRSQWTQANGEFSNSQVQINIDGVTVKNNNLAGSYTRQTSQAVEVFKNNQLAAMVSSDEVSANTGAFKDEIDMPPIKIVAQTDGWAFVKKEG